MDFEKYINSKIYHVFEIIYLLFIVNVIYLIANVIGLMLFIVFPASIALYLLLTNAKVRIDLNILKTFIRIIYKEYRKSQKVFTVLLITGLIISYQIYFFINIAKNWADLMIQIAFIVSLVTGYLYLSIWVHVISVYVFFPHFNTIKTLKYSLLLSIAFPIKTLMSISLILIMGGLIYISPAVALLGSFAILTLIIQKITLPIYKKIKIVEKPLDLFDYR